MQVVAAIHISKKADFKPNSEESSVLWQRIKTEYHSWSQSYSFKKELTVASFKLLNEIELEGTHTRMHHKNQWVNTEYWIQQHIKEHTSW